MYKIRAKYLAYMDFSKELYLHFQSGIAVILTLITSFVSNKALADR